MTAAGKTGEDAASEIGVSTATSYHWRRQQGGVETDAAKELKDLRG
nr:transposase [Nocardia neocaledoniensis]